MCSNKVQFIISDMKDFNMNNAYLQQGFSSVEFDALDLRKYINKITVQYSNRCIFRSIRCSSITSN